MKKRLFVAFKIKAGIELEDAYFALKEQLYDSGIKWVDLNNMHITLKFIGEVKEEAISAIINEVSEVVKGFSPFKIKIEGIGYFKKYNSPSVIFAKIDAEKTLGYFASLINEKLATLGVFMSNKDFKPHLTLGRVKRVKDYPTFVDAIHQFKGKHFQEEKIAEVILYESILQPIGPIYKPIEKFTLG